MDQAVEQVTRGVVVSLCDLTGQFVQPWVEAGFDAEQCRTFGMVSGAPWLVENPVSVLRRVFGPASHSFHPCDYTAHEPTDNYTKKPCLWTGGGFVMPKPARDLELGAPDDRIHKAPPSAERANFRSATPMGFARAAYQANARRVEAAA